MTSFEKLFNSMKFKTYAEKDLFEDMFNQYMSDLPKNFYRNQFDLAKEYPATNYEDWVKFLRHPAFDSWKSEQIAIIATTKTDEALAGGELTDRESLNLVKARQEVLKDEKSVEKPTIIVIPESLFFKND